MNLRNQLIDGDCLEIMPYIPAESVDLILTDPPYGMNYQSQRRPKSKRFDKLSNDNTIDWFPEFIHQAYRILKPDRHAYIFCTWRNYPSLYWMVKTTPFKINGIVVWNKLSHGSGDLHSGLAPLHEWIFFLSKGRRLWNRKEGLDQCEIKRKNGRPYDIWSVERIAGTKIVHPTEKPVKLLRHAIEYSTGPGELVFDPFAGSFSTAKACLTRESVTGDIEHRDYCCIELEGDKYIPQIKDQLALL